MKLHQLTRGSRAWGPLAGLGLLALGAFLLCGPAAAEFEAEPNNNLSTATLLPVEGSYVVTGTADSATDTADFFEWHLEFPVVADVAITSNWPCTGSACERVEAYASDGSALLDPWGNPVGGSLAYFSGVAGSTFYVRVTAGSPGGDYELSVDFYPFDYVPSEHVDIAAAIGSKVVEAEAYALVKSSVHPYDLQVEGDGVYYGYSLKLYAVNYGPYDLTIDVRSGQIFVPRDRNFTEYVVTRDQFVTVPSWDYVDVEFIAVARSPFGAVPGDPSEPNSLVVYDVGPRAGGDLLKVTDETDRGSYGFEAEQIAVWAVEAGFQHSDVFNIGGSQTAENEAKRILDRADVHVGLNAASTSRNWLAWIFTYWPFCFGIFFIGIPLLFGISQAVRAVRIGRLHIDSGYGGRDYDRSARFERREYIRQAREREKERERERREAKRQARESQARVLPAPPVVIPVAVPAPAERAAPTAYGTFMAMDAEERFDLDGLNGLDFNAVLAEATASKENAAACAKKAEQFMRRLHQDVADPDTIDDILRDRMVRWYRDSPKSPVWTQAAPRAWSGLVAESKAAGGRKRAPLERRFADLKAACDAKGKWIKPKPRDEVTEPWRRKGQTGPPIPDPPVMKAQIVQAVLDDMAAHPKGEGNLPLPVLSELAARYSTVRINNALAEIFKADPRGPYLVIHPSRYPDCDITVIKPPAQGAKAGALAYEIFLAKAPAQAAQQQGQTGAVSTGYVPTGGAVPGLLDTSGALWTRDSVPKEEWAAVLAELNRSRARLEPPPSNYRKLPPYFTLRELILSDETARRAFSGVKWRGKPVGLALLTQLLLDKSLTPEFDTDREYFEAELGDLERGDVNYQSPAGKWTIAGGIVVTRQGDASKGITYAV